MFGEGHIGKVACNRVFAWRGRQAHLNQLFIKNARLHRHLVYVSWRWYVLTYRVNLISLGLKIMWPCLIFAGKSYVKCRLYWQYIWSLSVRGQLLSKDMIGLANGKLNERKKIDGDIGDEISEFYWLYKLLKPQKMIDKWNIHLCLLREHLLKERELY